MDFLIGKWQGETKTRFDPAGEPEIGTIVTQFNKVVGDLFVEEVYSGTIGDKTHEGRRVFGTDARVQETTLYWMDTFHTGPTAIALRGPSGLQNISVTGHYYGGDEKWGWRIEFRKLSADKLEMKHFNIWPSGRTDLAIESTLSRV